MKRILFLSLCAASLSAAPIALAQVSAPKVGRGTSADVRSMVNPGAPCCGVLSVDSARGVVTAFEHASGNIFTFSVKDKALLSKIRPCQGFAANLGGAKPGVAIAADFSGKNNPAEVCCPIVSAPGTAGRVLGVQQHAKHEDVRIILTGLEREGDLVTANCLYCNGDAKKVSLASDLRARTGKAKLLDSANKTQHDVVRVQGGGSLVSDHGAGFQLGPNQALRTWMKFTAPKASTVTLVVPGAAEPFQNVPVKQ